MAISVAQADLGNENVLRVGIREISLRDICGSTRSELRSKFNQEVVAIGDDRMRRLLGVAKSGRGDDSEKALSREQMEAKLFEAQVNSLIYRATVIYFLAAVTDRVCRERSIVLEEWFDLDAIENAVDREVLYLKWLYGESKDIADSEKAIVIAKEKFGYRYDQAALDAARAAVREYPPLSGVNADVLRMARINHRLVAKACVAHELFKEACESGYYAKIGAEVMRQSRNPLIAIELCDYQGESEVALGTLKVVGTKEGLLLPKAISDIEKQMRNLGTTMSLRARTLEPDEAMKQGRPFIIGRPQRISEHGYMVYFHEAIAKGPSNAAEVEALKMFDKGTAFQIAARQFRPTVYTAAKLGDDQGGRLEGLVATSGVPFIANNVEMKPFVRKVYTGEEFEEWDRLQPILETLRLKAALAMAGHIERGPVVTEITKVSDEAKSLGIKRVLQSIIDKLRKQ